MRTLFYIIITAFCLTPLKVYSQELNCTVKVIHSQIQGTSTSVFETLEAAITEFMNAKAWTDLQFQKDERIECTMNITLTKYDASSDHFSGEILFQLARPVFNSSYNTTVFSMKDANLEFTYKEYDPLEWNDNNLDNNLTAVLAYYAYLFIGLDLDTTRVGCIQRLAKSSCYHQRLHGEFDGAFPSNAVQILPLRSR